MIKPSRIAHSSARVFVAKPIFAASALIKFPRLSRISAPIPAMLVLLDDAPSVLSLNYV